MSSGLNWRYRALFRFVARFLLLWAVTAIAWLALPSSARVDDGVVYPTNVLLSGRTLTQVYPADGLIPPRTIGKDFFTLDVSLDLASTSAHLVFPTYTTVPSSFPYSIWDTPPMELDVPHFHRVSLAYNASDPMNEKYEEEDPRDRLVTYPARVSNLDMIDLEFSGVNAPWFAQADAALFSWWLSVDFSQIEVTVMFKKGEVEGTEVAQVWPTGQLYIQDPQPLLTLTMRPGVNGAPPTILSASTPAPPISNSPSSSYRLRLAVLVALVPTSLILMGVYFLGQLALYAVFGIIVFLIYAAGTVLILGGLGVLFLSKWREEDTTIVASRVAELFRRPDRSSSLTGTSASDSGTEVIFEAPAGDEERKANRQLELMV